MQKRKRYDGHNPTEAEQFYAELPPPPFLSEAEETAFLRLRGALEVAYAPYKAQDFLNVSNIAYGIIEVHRLRQTSVALLQSPVILSELLAVVFGENVDKAKEVALAYYGQDRAAAKKATDLLADAGLTSSQIQGYASTVQLEQQRILRQLITSIEASNRRTMQDLVQQRSARLAEDLSQREREREPQLPRQVPRPRAISIVKR